MNPPKIAAILGVYGNPADRFMTRGYRKSAPSAVERIELVARSGMIRGIEVTAGKDDDLNQQNKKEILAALQYHDLRLCAVNPNLWGEAEWGRGTLGAPDAQTRSLAIDHIRSTMDLAAELDCDYVGIWPGQDGFDYIFEADYQKMYDWWVSGMQQCADHNPQIRLGLEFKPFEPRARSLLSNYTKTLLLIRDIDRPNVGLTFDVGHSLYARDNLGEVVALSQREGKLFHVHLNDNYADWDWDLNFGSAHLFDFLEMLYWLKRTAYQGWLSMDLFPYRTEGADSVIESANWLIRLCELVDRVDLNQWNELVAQSDPIAVSRFLRKLMFSD